MFPDDPMLTPDEEVAAAALRRTLHDTASDQSFQLELPITASRPRLNMAVPFRLFTGVAIAALVVAVAIGISYTGHNTGPVAPSEVTPSPRTPAMSEAESQSASAHVSFGEWQPILDVSEKLITSGSAAMHEHLGSAVDGVVAFKDYGLAATGENTYRITIYRSLDGVSWQSSEVPNSINMQDGDVACRGKTCVVLLGGAGEVMHALEVTSDLQHWTNVPMPLDLVAVGLQVGPSGFMIEGTDIGALSTPKAQPAPTGTGQHTLVSSDGVTWTDVPYNGRFVWMTDPAGGWVASIVSTGAGAGDQLLLSISSDGVTWHDVQDPNHLYSATDLIGRAMVHFQGRWYVYGRYRQMQAGWTSGGFGQPESSATPIAAWQTVYWIDDGSYTLQSGGKTSATLPADVVAASGVLVGERANDDFTAEMMISTDGLHWANAGLMPPGVPVPASIHGMPVMYLPTIAAAGPNVIAFGASTQNDVMGGEIYVTTPGS